MRIRIEDWATLESSEPIRRTSPRMPGQDVSRTAASKRKTQARKRQRKLFSAPTA